MSFSAKKYPSLIRLSSKMRLDVLNMINTSAGGHLGGSLSALDLIIAVYFSKIYSNFHFILSAGHLCPALYVVLANKGYFPVSKLSTYARFRSILQGHVSTDVPGVEYSSGALGQGLSFACGTALSDRKRPVICLTSDGEHQEGQIWEAALFAAKYHQGNLINLVDYNNCQIDGYVNDIMPLDDLAAKYLRFGWTVTVIDGHDYNQICTALKKSSKAGTYPHCIIAKTILGKGIPSIENDFHYHDVKKIDPVIYEQAKSNLQSIIKKLDPTYEF